MINQTLYDFDWYQRLVRALYPEIVGGRVSVDAILAANAGLRPIFFAEVSSHVPTDRLTPVGPLWRYRH